MTNINSLNQSDNRKSSQYDASADDFEIDLRLVFAQVRRNRNLLLGSLLLGLTLGVLGYLNATREYTADTTLMINVEGEAASQQGGDLIGALSLGKSDPIAPGLAFARSKFLLEKVVEELQLVKDPEFNVALRDPNLKSKITEAIRPAISALKALVKGSAEEGVSTQQDWQRPEVLELRLAVEILERRVTVTDLKDDLRLQISVTTEDRVKSARIAETMAIKLNELLRNTKASALDNAQRWIEGEAERVEGTLRDIEVQINAEMSAGSISPNSEALGQNAERLVEGELILEANRRRGQALQVLSEAVSLIEDGDSPQAALASLPDDLRTELFTDYIDIFRWERRDEPPSRSDLLAATALIKRDLDTQNAATTRREQEILPVRAYTRKLSTAQNRYLQLQTNYTASTDLLRTLRERLAELQIELAGEVERLTVLESPKPPLQHSSPSLKFSLAISALLGLMIGAGIILMRFFKRDAFLSLEDVEKTFDAPAISIVSDIRKGLQGGFAWDQLPSEIQEAYRRVYSAVFVMPEEQGSRSLMVASSIPGEGKTTTSLYTAAAAVEEGRRTLVIDLDFRKRSVSRYLKLTSDLGVYSVFRGEATLQEAVVRYEYGGMGFDVLTTDGRQKSKDANSRETLSAKHVRDLIETAKEEYDVVIVDVPPILAVQDANMVGRMVDAIFCVVSTQDLRKKAAQRASKEWKRAGLNLFGLLVRGEKNELHEYYDYSYYYYDYADKEDRRPRRPSQRRRTMARSS